MGPTCAGRPHSCASLSSPQTIKATAKLSRARGLRCPWAVAGPGNQKPTRGLRGLTAPPHLVGGRHGACEAWLRCPWAVAGPGRASRSTAPSRQARVWRSRGRAAAHGHTKQPGRGPMLALQPYTWRGTARCKPGGARPGVNLAGHGHATRPRPVSRPRPRR